MVFSKKLFISILCCMAMSAHAVFFRGERFVDRHGNSIECFGDLHIPCSKPSVTRNQQKKILEYAGDYNAFVIVEDMNARYEESGLTHAYDIDTTCTTPLDNLSTQCDAAGIDCCNVEFRELSAASLAGFPIPACDTVRALNKAISEIAHYTDCSSLDAYYKQTLGAVLGKNKSLIQELQQTDYSLCDYCQSLCTHAQERINLFDVALIDARILHALYEQKEKQTIFVCAGANHLQRIKPLLHKMGYVSLGVMQNDVIMRKKNLIDHRSALSIDAYFDHYQTQTHEFF